MSQPHELDFHEIHKKCHEISYRDSKHGKYSFFTPCSPKKFLADFPFGHFFDVDWENVTCKKCLKERGKGDFT